MKNNLLEIVRFEGPETSTSPHALDRVQLSEHGTDGYGLTDTGNANSFTDRYRGHVKFDHQRKRWMVWAGHRWMADVDGAVERLARDTIRGRRLLAAADENRDRAARSFAWAIKSESRQRREALLACARSEEGIADAGDRWDADPWLLGVPNGVVDLRTGLLRDGHPDDRITKSTAVPYDPAAECPTWVGVVSDIFNGDDVLAAYTQRSAGYALTGITSEQCFHVPYGVGANGKSTLYGTILKVVGDYGYQMPFSTVLGTKKDAGATNDLAALDGKRFVLASEANEGARLDEARIKSLTGGDAITARWLYGEYFSFRPVAKFFLLVNHRPTVRDDSHGFWRRMRLLPFTRTFPVNTALDGVIQEDLVGILAWAVRGCLLWQREGLGLPAAVEEATNAYRRDSDVLTDFLHETCDLAPDAEVSASGLFAAYQAWATRQGMGPRDAMSQTQFGRKVSERYPKRRLTRGAVYQGLSLRGDGL